MNENIKNYLSTYMENPDPRYAVLLKGKWGSGKSYFIKNWINDYKEKEKDNLVVLEPIYVSLYGLKEIEQIKLAIDRVLHPILYSKGADYVKKFLKLAGKVVLKANLDFNDDNNEDLTFETTLDSFSLLSTKKSEGISSKLIVFDDFERCLIDTKDLLGCINNFVEHGACHVIIIGDETHISKLNKKDFIQFKEKTIGREFEVLPDIEGAINSFIDNDLGKNEWLIKHKTFISDCFKQTKYNNLRILRQCLYDFNILHRSIDSKLLEKGDLFMMNLLGSYIVTYCEFKGESHELIKEWESNCMKTIFASDDEKKEVIQIKGKYKFIDNKYYVDVLNTNYITLIVSEITTGKSIKRDIEIILRDIRGERTLQDKLLHFRDLSNTDFNNLYKELENEILYNKSLDFYMRCLLLNHLLSFDYNGLKQVSKKVLTKAKKHIINYLAQIKDREDLYRDKMVFINSIVNSNINLYETGKGLSVKKTILETFKLNEGKLQDKMSSTLLSLSDENVDSLIKLSNSSTPDHHCTYNMTSIFINIDSKKFINNVLKLSNKSKNIFCLFLYAHYEFNFRLGDNCYFYKDDLLLLQELYRKIETILPKKKQVDKLVLNKLLRYLEGAIKRAEGFTEVINIE